MHVVIAKVDEVFYDGEVHSMTVPGMEGEMTVLGEHMPLMTTLKAGDVVVRASGDAGPQTFHIEGGVLEVRRDGATIIL